MQARGGLANAAFQSTPANISGRANRSTLLAAKICLAIRVRIRPRQETAKSLQEALKNVQARSTKVQKASAPRSKQEAQLKRKKAVCSRKQMYFMAANGWTDEGIKAMHSLYPRFADLDSNMNLGNFLFLLAWARLHFSAGTLGRTRF